jgi:hypothetical protein
MKISKKDQPVNMNEQEGTALDELKSRKSPHFTEDTWVLYQNRRGKILGRATLRGETILTVDWEDGRLSTIKPIALNR